MTNNTETMTVHPATPRPIGSRVIHLTRWSLAGLIKFHTDCGMSEVEALARVKEDAKAADQILVFP